jgi:hypothetical protein
VKGKLGISAQASVTNERAPSDILQALVAGLQQQGCGA